MAREEQAGERLERILGPTGEEVSCERCFELLDEYVELELSGGAADRALPGMRTHLEACPACAEDHRSLRDLVRADAGRSSRGA